MSDHDADLRARRAASFGGLADAYEEHRPGYPAAAVRWAVEPLGDPAPLRALDLAAGTGKLTRQLLAVGLETVAVEPDPQMLERLRRAVPEATAHAGRAEEIPLPDASVDAVFVGQALHWFDRDAAFPEIARVLRPGGVLSAMWNADDHAVEWVAGLARASRRDVNIVRRADLQADSRQPVFGLAERRFFDHSQRRTAESLTATVATHSHVAVLPAEERAALLADVRRYLDSLPQTGHGEFDLPLVTIALRWRRPA